ncbi:hypothetical protein [Streptomyces sp. KR80]|uniref:hypothetical protein n=1 Tax=Streptomyces sp. KR80 TaxID=3457426 RepID=UPI003FD2482C
MAELRWCSWHQQHADDAVLVAVAEVGSGPGIMRYACRRCRVVFALVPLEPDDGRDRGDGGCDDSATNEPRHS